jgi:hypothetical protein
MLYIFLLFLNPSTIYLISLCCTQPLYVIHSVGAFEILRLLRMTKMLFIAKTMCCILCHKKAGLLAPLLSFIYVIPLRPYSMWFHSCPKLFAIFSDNIIVTVGCFHYSFIEPVILRNIRPEYCIRMYVFCRNFSSKNVVN